MIQNAMTYELKPWLSPGLVMPLPYIRSGENTLAQGRPSVGKTGQFCGQSEFQKVILLTPRAKPLSSPWQIPTPDSHSSLPTMAWFLLSTPLSWVHCGWNPPKIPLPYWALLTVRALPPFLTSPAVLSCLQRELTKPPALPLESQVCELSAHILEPFSP